MFPITVCDVGEGQRNCGWGRFCYAAICEITNRRTTAQRRNPVGPFCFPALPAESVPQRGRTPPRRAAHAGNGTRRNPFNVVGKYRRFIPRSPCFRPRKHPKGVVHADAFRRIVNPPDPSPHRIHFFDPNTAREPQRGPLPPASPIPAGRGTVGAPLRLAPMGRVRNKKKISYNAESRR
jgi:hypothetical protein